MDDGSRRRRVGPPPGAFDVWGSAPGRVEFIGNHVDYNGGWVLGTTIDRRVDVTLRARADTRIHLQSAQSTHSVEADLNAIRRQGEDQAWANYILGVLVALREEGLAMPHGFDLNVYSTLPVGAGLSSSAALELATALALSELFGGAFDRRTLAQLCRQAENEFVGVPCGILDQAVVACGDVDRLVCVDARTDTISPVPFPSHTRLWIFRTHRSHALAEAHYEERHDEAHAARRRLNDLLGGIEHLVDVQPEQLEAVRDHAT